MYELDLTSVTPEIMSSELRVDKIVPTSGVAQWWWWSANSDVHKFVNTFNKATSLD